MGHSITEPKLEKRSFAAGREIFCQGEEGDSAYLVESGSVRIYQQVDGQRIELGVVKAGELFGEMAAIDGGRRMATAVAQEPTVATRIPKAMFDRKLAESDKFVRGILNFFIRTIRGNHRHFLRRPRSANDQLRLMGYLTRNLRAFAAKSGAPGADLSRHLDELERVLAVVGDAARKCPDARHDLIVELPADGAS